MPPEPPARTGETVVAPPDSPRTGQTVVPPAPVRTGQTVHTPVPELPRTGQTVVSSTPARTGQTVHTPVPELPRTGQTVVSSTPTRTGQTVHTPVPEQPVAAAPVAPPMRSIGVPPPGLPPTLTPSTPRRTPAPLAPPPGLRPPPSLLPVPPPPVPESAASDEEDEGDQSDEDDSETQEAAALFANVAADELGGAGSLSGVDIGGVGAFDDGELGEDEGYADDEGDDVDTGENPAHAGDVAAAEEPRPEPEEDISTGDYPDDGFEDEDERDDGPPSRDFADDLTRHTAAPTGDGPRFVSVSSGVDSFGDLEDFAVTGGRGMQDEERGDTPTSADGLGGGSSSKSSGSHPRRDALFGQVLADRYRVLDLIGKGGMGKVYLAEHVALGKRVAVKVLNPAYTHRPDQVKRFLREAQAASTIGHENVIDITDFGEMANGSVFFAMEHLQGEDLGKLLKRVGALNWPRARRIVLQICRALQAAHARGIIHRDMKPENCFIIHRNGMRDFVKVLDFGIAKFLEENRQVSHTLTQAGALIGTPEYMAPEQVQGEAADVRMDIYALGCIMYQLLTGQLPFSDKTMFGVLSQQVNVKPVAPRQLAPDADIPVEVEAIILKAMEKERSARFQTMAELIEALVAAPRGTSDGRGGTTSNLEAAASAARMAAAMNAAAAATTPSGTSPLPGVATTPQDMSFAGMSGRPMDSQSAQWPEVGRDPALMTKVVIALVAIVLVLVVGLVCALTNKTDDASKTDAVAATSATKDATPPEPVVVPPPVTPPSTPDPAPDPTAGADEGVIIDDPDPTKTTPTPPTKKDPVKKDPRKDPKKDPGKTNPPPNLPEPSLEKLEPMDLNRVLTNYKKDVESCRAAKNGPRGVVAVIKLKIEGASGRVLEATPTDANVAAPCIAKFVKNKVKFPRFKQKVQELNARFPM
ncbi:MAG: protein kinase [Myxococcales bacterium]|nr:protein kinase [Myxococcales bacterium]